MPPLSDSSARSRRDRRTGPGRALALGLLALAALGACQDQDPTAPTADPSAFTLTLPDTAYAGQPFQVTVTAVGAGGAEPDTEFSGEVSLSISGGTVSPATVLVTAGVGQENVTVADVAGDATFSASRGTASGSGALVVVGLEPVASIQIVPGSMMFTDASQTRQLVARAYDANGNPTQAAFTWTSTEPGLVAVDAAGLVTSGAGLGSAQILAQSGGVASPPAVAILARPVAGAILVGDESVVRSAAPAAAPGAARSVGPQTADSGYDVEPVDPDVEYGLGWQYRVTLTGVEPPSTGQILVGTGEAPIAGRVVAVTTIGSDHVVTLELIAIDEVFEDLVYDEELALDDAEILLSEEVADAYTVQRSRDGTLDFIPRADVPLRAVEFSAGPFQCKSDVGLPLQLRVVPVLRIRPSLRSFSEFSIATGLTRSGVRGGADFEVEVSPKVAARLEGVLECKWESPIRIIIPLPGPVGLFLGGHVPLGAGFELKGTATLAEFGSSVKGSASVSLDIGVECTNVGVNDECSPFATSQGQGNIESRLDEFTLTEQDRLQVQVYPFMFAALGVGPSAILSLGLGGAAPRWDLVEARAGFAHQLDLKSSTAQINEQNYDSDFRIGFLALVKPGSAIEKFLKLFNRTAIKLEARVEVPLTSLPKGTIQVDTDRIRAFGPQQPGDTVTFTIELDKSTFLALEVVKTVHILWTRPNDAGAFELEQSPFPCEVIPAQSGQTVFECRTDFPEQFVGENRFHAFLELELFGAPMPGYYEVGDDAMVTVTVESGPRVDVSPRTSLLVDGESAQFTATTSQLSDPSVTWGAALGAIDGQGSYLAPIIPEGTSVVDTIVATSVEDPTVKGRALVVVTHPRILPSGLPCVPSQTDDCTRNGRSYGDPHIMTPDGMIYDFMASGDYVLARSTDPEDDFEVQARYIKPDGDELFSWNRAAAMRVMGNVVEVYAIGTETPDVRVNGGPAVLRTGDIINLIPLDGGSVTLSGDTVVVSWPDRTMVMVKPSQVDGVLSEILIITPYSRSGAVEGLFGDFDGDDTNDVRTGGGEVLEPGSDRLYTDFRRDWWVPLGSERSLFNQGTEQFDSSFPPGQVRLEDLRLDDASRATAVCRDAGVLDPDVMEKCILDVVLTGDDRWALVAVGADPNTLGILVSPQVAFVAPDDSQEFGAVVTGTTDRRVQWSATGGTVQSTADNVMTYTAPSERGTYTITATSLADGSLVATATVEVTGAATGFSKQWNGSVSGLWSEPANWTPAGVPDSTDDVYVPASAQRPLSQNIYPIVTDIVIEAGAATAPFGGLTAKGDADIEAANVWLTMTGANKTVRGRMYTLLVSGGAIRANGPLFVTGRSQGGIYLYGGVFDVGDQRVEVVASIVAAAEGGGRLVMQDPAGHLIVGGATFYNLSSAAGSLTAGTLELRQGGLTLTPSAQFVSSDEHRIVFWGDGTYTGQGLSPTNSPTPVAYQVFNDLEFDNPGGVLLGAAPIRVDGVVTVTAGRVWTQDATVHLMGALIDPTGGWEVPLMIRTPGVVLPSVLNANITYGWEVGGETVDATLTDDFEVNGQLTVANGSRLTLGSNTLRAGTLTTRANGSLVMDSDADTLVVSGNATFGDGPGGVAEAGGLFSAGVFEIGGDLRDNFHHLRASGTHTTVFNGSTPQTTLKYCLGCPAFDLNDPKRFQGLEVLNPAGVTFTGTPMVVGGITVAADALAVLDQDAYADQSLDVSGTLTLPETRTLSVTGALLLRSSGILNNSGTMTVGSCSKEAGYTINGVDPCP